MATKKGLGKGLGALLSVDGIPETQKDSVVELKINDISPNSEQPRKRFNEDALQELADSIKENGVIQPIIVSKRGSGYRIVAGERRWRASRLAGLKVIPAIVRDLTDQQTMEQALIENIQRQDLNPLEEAFAMDNLMKEHGLTQEALAKKLGKSRPAIANTLRLINIDESLQDFIRNGDLSAGHARALLAITDKEEQKKAADVVMIKEMSVRETEEYVKKILSGPSPAPRKTREKGSNAVAISTKDVEHKLTSYYGTKVKLKLKDEVKGKGTIVIEYYSYDDLDRLLEMMEN
ncbi:MAG: ParB/RepB/Spo0J family partition protein [Clostridiales bacterium]|nr:ParB/RepB/Spo0J family partition protein [Butyrivibrio sp.]MBQ5966681.1 ParB/RepB/Spo0J family partition protein [Clostridiales bacterium]MBQ6272527.1 ParB/RepB/Spo0J family partition protein [Clostridiales bacterium]MCR5058587.1 ParB/RepB/Spo0J family partition protein [Clostridiales bacterium]